ncbi:MAG: Mu-like prophage major head subunit gpT family protein [Zoogloeaceae bacterium]|jgi:phage major head subunit gpT-like protein|nr:Mu-like prophage major head subunit gpT family protein [Zoogloeaceae bacterium]
MILNKDKIAAAYVAFRADYEAGKLAANPIAPKLAMNVRSSTAEESYAWLGTNSSLREWIGDKHFNGLTLSGFNIKNKDFEHTITVLRNDIEDARIGVLSGAFQMMGQDAALHPDSLLFELIKQGTTEQCYDGKPFFSTQHPADGVNAKSGAVSNVDLANAGDSPTWLLLDTTKVIKPFILQTRKDYSFISIDKDTDEHVFKRGEFIYGVEARLNAGFGLWQLAYASSQPLDAAAIAAADASMMSLKSPTGKPLGITPNILMVAPSAKEDALKLLKLETSHYRDAFELIVCPWL